MNFFRRKKKASTKVWVIAFMTPMLFFFLIASTVGYILETPFRVLKDVLNPHQLEQAKEIKKKMGFFVSDLGRIALPLEERYISLISSPFGQRKDPVTGELGKMHNGVDFACPTGTDVFAMKSGKVIAAGWWSTNHSSGYGKYIMIMHEDVDGKKNSTIYAHLDEILVKLKDQVKIGQKIALSGNTGKSTGPHLHFELRFDDRAVDPMDYLSGEEDSPGEEEEIE